MKFSDKLGLRQQWKKDLYESELRCDLCGSSISSINNIRNLGGRRTCVIASSGVIFVAVVSAVVIIVISVIAEVII